MNLAVLDVVQLARMIRKGEISARELVEACIGQIEAAEDSVGAWAHIDFDHARKEADARDALRATGIPCGPLHGIPVGIKDIFDTADYPTEYGTELYRGRTPVKDAMVVSALRGAGAIILGKTVSTEMAVYAPGKTTNPHDPTRTPGGSSSGSAAAVAAGMVPLSVGTQTNGSMIRPASFCGVYGFKPSHGLISRHRILKQSPPLDTVGVFARTLEDLALIAETLMVYDSRDPHMRPRSHPRIVEIMAEAPPVEPNLAFIRTPVWDQAENTTKDAFQELTNALGGRIEIIDLPTSFDDAIETHRRIMEADLAKNFAQEYADGKARLSAVLCEMIERGQTVLATEYNTAVEHAAALAAQLDDILIGIDAIVTPSTIGEAPVGLDSTGSPVFCTLWSLCGMPSLNLPLLQGPAGMPLGTQLVAAKHDDARLFRTTRWLIDTLRP